MQRGTVRRRSPEEGEDIEERPKQRQRQRFQFEDPSVLPNSEQQTRDTIIIGQHHIMGPPPVLHQSSSLHAGPSSDTSRPLNISSHVLDQIRMFRPQGTLLYQDDKDWVADHGTDVVMDGSGGSNGEADGSNHITGRPRTILGKRMPVDREELIRLILQSLRDIGYDQSADVLQRESGYQLSSRSAVDFQAAILAGRWSEAIALVPSLGVSSETAISEPVSSRSSVASGKSKTTGKESPADAIRFLIAKQKYLEYLESSQQKKALAVLRTELATSATSSETLHDLSGYMMCLDRDDLYERAKWDGASGISRRQLLERLQTHISPKIMVPSRRLATLLDQARQYQQLSCLYHNDHDLTSLYTDHQCASGAFPSVTTHVLADHLDEVWRIEWSPDGTKLASAGKDKLVVIWQLQTKQENNRKFYDVIPMHHLKDHREPVDALAWSPDGETLVTAADKEIYVWDIKTGKAKVERMDSTQHSDTISAIQWLPDGSQFIVASLDCRVVFYTLLGNVTRNWTINGLQIIDFAITPDATRMVAVTTWLRRVPEKDKLKPSMSARVAESSIQAGTDQSKGFEYGTMEHGLMVIRLEDRDITDYVSDIRGDNTSLKMSQDGQRVLVSCAPDEIRLFSLSPQLHLLKAFTGHIQGRFLIRSCFGAPKDRFVLSGSEDGHVYVWQSNSCDPIEVLSGHGDTVNAVAWNPVHSRRLFASCSDDSTIRIWQPSAITEETGDDAVDGLGEVVAVDALVM